ncbi:MAG: class I SAM-dependent methyltransferase [Chloroflexota bacterium]
MNFDLIAKYYDFLHGQLEEDLEMWEVLTHEVDGPILEVGCGTGRLLSPLAQAGQTLTGVDISATALSLARAKLDAMGMLGQVTLYQADMRTFDLPQKDFAAALLPLNTFMHCHTQADQLAALRTIQRHLRPDGQLFIDLFYPDPLMLAEVDGRLYFEAETQDELTGHTIQWTWRHDIDLAEQMRHLTYILDEVDAEGYVRRVTLPFSLRFVYRFELELLLAMTGFTTAAIYGSYELEPFDSHSPRMIFVARKTADVNSDQ